MDYSMILMLVVMIGVFYLKVGDDITTIGGITGTICALKEDTVVIESGADRVRIELTKWSISTKGIQTSQDAEPEPAKKEKKDKKEKKSEEK